VACQEMAKVAGLITKTRMPDFKTRVFSPIDVRYDKRSRIEEDLCRDRADSLSDFQSSCLLRFCMRRLRPR